MHSKLQGCGSSAPRRHTMDCKQHYNIQAICTVNPCKRLRASYLDRWTPALRIPAPTAAAALPPGPADRAWAGPAGAPGQCTRPVAATLREKGEHEQKGIPLYIP